MRSFSNSHAAIFARLLAVGVGAASLTSALSAQQVDARWVPWLGCWAPQTAAPGSDGVGLSTSQLVCLTPAPSGSGVNISTVIEGKIVSAERLDVTGAKVSKMRDGCSGWEQATWAPNAHRVTMRSEFTCADGGVRKSSGIFAISPAGEFMQVHGINVAGNAGVRVALFEAARLDSIDGAPAYVPSTGFAAQTARLGASSEVSSEDVLDVSKHVDAPVAEAWLTAVGQGFNLDARSLVKLADAGLPPRMMDLMVALSNPKAFVVSANGNRRAIDRTNPVATSNLQNGRAFPLNSYGYLPIDYGLYGAYGMNSYLYGMGLGRNYGSYGYNSWYGNGFGNPYSFGFGGYSPQVVIVNRGDYEAPPKGRAVNGSGYTRGNGGGGTSARDAYPTYDRSAAPRASAPSSSSGGGYSGGASSSSSSSGSGSSSSGGSSSGGGDRTAKPRPPGN